MSLSRMFDITIVVMIRVRDNYEMNFSLCVLLLVGASAPTIHLGSNFLCQPDVQLSVVSLEV